MAREVGKGVVPQADVATVRDNLIVNDLASSDTIYERQEERDQQLLLLPLSCILKSWLLNELIYTCM